MKRVFHALLGMACVACSGAMADAIPPPPPEAAQYQDAVADAQHWGQLMFDHDQAAWKATDLLLKAPDRVRRENIRGWITEPAGGGIRVVFIGEEGGRPVAIYETNPSSPTDFITDSPGRALTAEELAEYTARETAKTAQTERCSDKFNTVVLPETSGSERKWRVYLIPGTTDPDLVPLGGYFRYQISADGKTVIDHRAFTKSCLTSSLKNGRKGYDLADFMVSHLLDPQPTEVHVFISLTYKKPIFVVTSQNHLLWHVRDCCIRAIEKIAPKK